MLYHFTSRLHWKLIRREGLTKGGIPNDFGAGQMGMIYGFQWLTADPDWSQDWETQSGLRLPYRRTELRLEVTIPRAFAPKLVAWPEFAVRANPSCREAFSRFASSRHWFVFIGPIPRDWILAHSRNPNPIELPAYDAE